MTARVAFVSALILTAAAYSGILAQSRAASDALLGRWDLAVQGGTQTSPSSLDRHTLGAGIDSGQCSA